MDRINVKIGASPAVGVKTGIMPEYTGECTVVPKLGQQTVLNTAKHYLSGNITVREIPVTVQENEAGGLTLTVGGADDE
ncbi:MAG TPA: hypothetical protein DDX72_10555 [Ruminococcaceae bacterium]|nr:hypothetical protein [Oscillospiraceae bacterium]